MEIMIKFWVWLSLSYALPTVRTIVYIGRLMRAPFVVKFGKWNRRQAWKINVKNREKESRAFWCARRVDNFGSSCIRNDSLKSNLSWFSLFLLDCCCWHTHFKCGNVVGTDFFFPRRAFRLCSRCTFSYYILDFLSHSRTRIHIRMAKMLGPNFILQVKANRLGANIKQMRLIST